MNIKIDDWKVGKLIQTEWVSKKIKSFKFEVASWQPHKAGQHYAVRLTAPDGYQASRYYSVLNSPSEKGLVELGIEIIPDGEVSGYLRDIEPGEQIELKGPLGGHFNWSPEMKDDLILIGAGSGIVPLLSILRQYSEAPDNRRVKLIYTAREYDDILYREELLKYDKDIENLEIELILTRQWPEDWKYRKGRIDKAGLEDSLKDFDKSDTDIYICGRTAFVEDISKAMVEIGFQFEKIKGERYG